jgi:hypothetical protein
VLNPTPACAAKADSFRQGTHRRTLSTLPIHDPCTCHISLHKLHTWRFAPCPLISRRPGPPLRARGLPNGLRSAACGRRPRTAFRPALPKFPRRALPAGNAALLLFFTRDPVRLACTHCNASMATCLPCLAASWHPWLAAPRG